MNFGERLKMMRKASGLTQEELAGKISARGFTTSASYISMIERIYDRRADGQPTRPARQFVEYASEILGDDVNEALMDADYAPRDRELFKEMDEGLYRGIRELPPHLRPIAKQQVRAVIEALAQIDQPDIDYIDDEEDKQGVQ